MLRFLCSRLYFCTAARDLNLEGVELHRLFHSVVIACLGAYSLYYSGIWAQNCLRDRIRNCFIAAIAARYSRNKSINQSVCECAFR